MLAERIRLHARRGLAVLVIDAHVVEHVCCVQGPNAGENSGSECGERGEGFGGAAVTEVDIFAREGRVEHGGVVAVDADEAAVEGVGDGFSGGKGGEGEWIGGHFGLVVRAVSGRMLFW